MEIYKNIILTILLLTIGCDDDKNDVFNEKINNSEALIEYGIGEFSFTGLKFFENKPLTIYTFAPDSNLKDLRVVFVMHGNNRNGKEYCFEWVKTAQNHKFLLLCPNFDELNYPGSENYQLGGMWLDNAFIDSSQWTYNFIDSIHKFLLESNYINNNKYAIYGHSAGAQFVHRYAEFIRPLSAEIIISANAGWYTRIDTTEQYPYGLKNSPIKTFGIKDVLNLPVTILLGELDINPNASSLRKTEEAMRQGKHRFERGNFFYNEAKEFAESKNWQFNWRLDTVPNVGHSNLGMAETAGLLIHNAFNQ